MHKPTMNKYYTPAQQAAKAAKPASQSTGYSGHLADGSGLQAHSCGEPYRKLRIIMSFAPLQNLWVAMRNGERIAFGRDYRLTLGQAVIRILAAPAMGGKAH